MEIGPRCRVAYTRILFNLQMGLTSAQLPERTYIKDFKGYIIHVNKNRSGELEDVMVWVLKDETNMITYIRAARGRLGVDAPNKRVSLILYDGKSLDLREGQMILMSFVEAQKELDFGQKRQPTFRPAITDMTSGQLWDELHEWER
jgi:hypothetical protein